MPPRWLLVHSAAVADVAAFLGRALEWAGVAVDRPLIEASALLHDVGKLGPGAGDGESHGRVGAEWLTRHGYGELAPAVAEHPVTTLSIAERRERWLTSASWEARVVAYADRRADLRRVSATARLDDMVRRHPDHRASIERARPHVDALEHEICATAGIRAEDVRRLRWATAALAAATRDGARSAGAA
jgi:putative nucleotidyltransferase with HDIG domain